MIDQVFCSKPPSNSVSERGIDKPLTDFHDPRLDDYRFLRERDLSGARRSEGLFVGETIPIVIGMLAIAGITKSVVSSQRMAERVAHAIAQSASPQTPLFRVEDAVLEQTAGFDLHRGVLAIGLRSALDERSPFDHPFPTAKMLLALDSVSNMDNVGALFRGAAAFGVGGVLLSRNSHDPLYRKSLRVSMGHALTIPYAWCDDLAHTIMHLRTTRPILRVLAADCARDAQDIATFDAQIERSQGIETPPTMLVVGNEHDGISPAVMAVVTHRVRIPIADSVDSLNAAVAASICLHRIAHPIVKIL